MYPEGANAMQTLALMIGYGLWFVFVIAWNVTARPAPTLPHRERGGNGCTVSSLRWA